MKAAIFDVDTHGLARGYLLAAQKLSFSPEECVVFEDAVLDVEAARRAGMKCMGIDRYGKPERLKRADLVVSDLGKITVKKIKELF